MAGRTPNRNTRRPASGSRRPAGNTRRAPQSTRRPSQSRRRTARRRSPSLLARPGFWLFICILIIVFILIFRGCGSEDMTEGQTVVPTDSVSASGPVIMGNTEPATEENKPDGQGGDNNLNNDNDPPTPENGGQSPSEPDPAPENGGQSPFEPDPAPENGGQSQTVHLTKSVQPGVYLIGGRSGGLPAGRVNIEVLSGTGCAISSDGELSSGVISPDSAQITAVELRAGTYLSVSGSLNLKMSYISEPAEPSVTPPSVNEDSLMYELGSYETETSYIVMSEGGDLTPGFYQVEIYEGEGVLTVKRKSGGGVDYFINENNNYTVNYLKLSDGDRVTVKGCVMVFTEMKEG